MTQMWLVWWPKNTFSHKRHGEAITATATATAISGGAAAPASSCSRFSSSSRCPCLSKVVRKLKKHAQMMGLAPNRQAGNSSQCRYDPLSYSLNFDDTSAGCRNLLDNEDYYHFCAFSSRFVANPRTACPTPAHSISTS